MSEFNFWRKYVICFCSWRVKRINWRICCIIIWWRRGIAFFTIFRKCRWLIGVISWSNIRRSWNRRTRNLLILRSKLKVGGSYRVRLNKMWMWSCVGIVGLCCYIDLFFCFNFICIIWFFYFILYNISGYMIFKIIFFF